MKLLENTQDRGVNIFEFVWALSRINHNSKDRFGIRKLCYFMSNEKISTSAINMIVFSIISELVFSDTITIEMLDEEVAIGFSGSFQNTISSNRK